MRPDYPLPDPKAVRPIDWAWIDDEEHGRIVELRIPGKDRTSRQRPWTGHVHEGLDAGEGVSALLQRLRDSGELEDDDRRLRRRLGTYLFQLHDVGLVELDFPVGPERFANGAKRLGCLGRGGIGVVWRARHDDADHDVAIKHAWDFFGPLEATDRLIRHEDEVLRSLDHPGIVRRDDVFEHDGLLHIQRELVDGRPFALSALDLTAWRARALEATEIIEHLHLQGWLLLDARPANFFVRDRDDQLVLVDVGACVHHEGIGVQHERRLRKSTGSPGFSAPETRTKHRASTASDVYGLGRLLFAMATGHIPLKSWRTEDMTARMDDHPFADLIGVMCATERTARPSLDEVRERLVQGSRAL